MTTLLISQPNFESHVTPAGHPERPERIRAVEEALAEPQFDALVRRQAVTGDLALAELVHDSSYLARLQAIRPAEGIAQIDKDTFISSGSLDAAATGLGGALMALDAVILGEADNAFCAIRPPGHHAESSRPMGFCLINTIAIAARMAQKKHGADRIAIIDFDVHHGNGTQDIFYNDSSVFYASSHEMPLFPGTGSASETGVGNVFNVPLTAGSGTAEMRAAYDEIIFPALADFAPDILLVSAGFDADYRDPLAHLEWKPEDFSWISKCLLDFATDRCGGRLVSLLEGGYDLEGVAAGAMAHVAALLGQD